MYQNLILSGRLGRDPEMKFTPSGSAVCSFSVATDHTYVSNGQKVKETTWFRVSVWGKLAEVCNQYLKKGSLVLVDGRLTPDKSTGGPRVYTKQDGTASASFEVNAQTVRFLSGTKSGDEVKQTEEEPF